MIVKAATFLLVAVAVLAMLGGLRGRRGRLSRYCPDCGRPRIGRGPCPCQQRKG